MIRKLRIGNSLPTECLIWIRGGYRPTGNGMRDYLLEIGICEYHIVSKPRSGLYISYSIIFAVD